MTDAVDQVFTTQPQRRAVGVNRLLWPSIEIERIPTGHERAQVERKRQLRLRCLRTNGLLTHEVGVQGRQVIVTHARVGRVRKRRVQMMTVARNALTHGALKGAERPRADARLHIGRDVGGVDRAKGRVHRQPARHRMKGVHRVALRTVAQRCKLSPSLDDFGEIGRAHV